VRPLCWCGAPATHNARTENGVMVTEGEQVVVGDILGPDDPPSSIAYEVLCRPHHRRGLTRAVAGVARADPLPFERADDVDDDG
jgi:thymidine kinase